MNLSIPTFHVGAYANIARHNIFLILNDIAQKAGQSQMAFDDENLIITDANGKMPHYKQAELKPVVLKALKGTDKVVQAKIIELLYSHFPFLKALSYQLYADNPSPLHYYYLLRDLLYAVEAYRNCYTHIYHSEVEVNPDVFSWMDKIFDDALDIAKKRFNLEEGELINFRRWEGKKKENRNFKYKFTDKQNQLQEKGLVFLFSLFLENDHVFKFLSKIKGLENKTAKEIYCIHNCILPQYKLKSDTGSDALILNILIELQRCPVELYDHLMEEDQQDFITKEQDENSDAPESVLVRKQNRFPYYALSYIEYSGVFKTLLPQLDLGKFVFHSYAKTGPDNESYIRRWEKNIHVYSRLCDVESDYPETLEKLRKDPAFISDDTPPPYLVATNPHYNFIDKNIGFKIKTDVPLISPFKKKTDTRVNAELNMPMNVQPDFFLCTDELPGLLFFDFLATQYKNKENAEQLILSHLANIKRFLKDVSDGKIVPVTNERLINQYQEVMLTDTGLSKKKFKTQYKDRKGQLAEVLQEYNLHPHMIPEKLSKYLMGVENVGIQDKAFTAFNALLEETEELLEIVTPTRKEEKNRKKEKRQNRVKHLKAGERATYLAQDMLFFQPHYDKEGKDAPNPDEYRKLQAALAFFSRDKEHIGRVFLMCGLTHSGNPHPFLDKIDIDKCKTNLDFYTRYLQQRKAYINDCVQKNKANADFASSLKFLNSKQIANDAETMRAYAKRVASQPVNLPRGLFKDAVVALIRENGSDKMKQALEGGNTKSNIVYLLTQYFTLNGDSYQDFYDYKRRYRVVDEWFDKRNRNNKTEMRDSIDPKPLSIAELTALEPEIKQSDRKRKDGTPFYNVYSRVVLDNEKLIRHYRTCDMMSFIICKELIAATGNDSTLSASLQGQFLLKEIAPNSEKSILNTFIEYKLPRASKTISDKIKIKDYGKFRRFLKDRRLNTLLEYFEKQNITRDELRTLLDTYERKRLFIFEKIAEFEKACEKHEHFAAKIDTLLKTQGFIKHKHLLEIYTSYFQTTPETIQNINMIRNAFSHNQFPAKEKLLTTFSEDNLVENMAGYLTAAYDEMINNLKNQTV